MICNHCKREDCNPILFRLCECEGAGCPICKESPIPGILPAVERSPEGGNITVCTQWGDPEIDAAIDDQRPSLIKALTEARDAVLREM